MSGLKAHARRMAATALAVILGVGFVAGTLIFSDTTEAGFYDTFARVAKNVDVAVERGSAPLTEAQLATVRALPGVRQADARMTTSLPLLDKNNRPITNFGRVGFAVNTDGSAELRAFDVDGRLPGNDGEAVLDKETAAHQKLSTGSVIAVADRAGQPHTYTLTGLVDFGVSPQFSGASVVGLPSAEIQRLVGVPEIDEIVVAGTDPAALKTAVQRAVGTGPTVVTGDQRREDLANSATSVATNMSTILLIFGSISLIVAVFVIYNTFAILLAQRVRETALLRCVGATRKQIFQATVAESTVVGLAGGLAGIGLGVAIAAGLPVLFNDVLHAGIPAHAVVLRPAPILIGLAIGLVATVAAALVPAFRATRTSPLAALRDQPTGKVVSRTRRAIRSAAALLIGGAGVLLTSVGSGHPDPQTGTFILVAGGVVAFLGVLVAAPLFVGPLSALVGLPFRAVGTPGRVAVANARRNPGRTAITAASLMIGVGLMALFSVVLASIKQTAHDQLAGHYPVDYVINGVQYSDHERAAVPAAFARNLRTRPGFETVAEIRVVTVRLNGHPARLAASDHDFTGTPSAPTGSVILDDDFPATTGTATVVKGQQRTALRVADQRAIEVPGDPTIDGIVSWDQLAALGGSDGDAAVLVKAADGVSPTASRDAVDQAASAYPLMEVNSVADLSSDLDKQVNSLIALFAGLLGTAILIALAGIANTLSLSVVERTRESATLRAVGLTRPQLRGTLLVEAVVMGLVGATVGVAFGLIYGPLVVRQAFSNIGPTVVVSWTWLAGLVAIAAVASCLAAVLPARRAAQSSIVAALADL